MIANHIFLCAAAFCAGAINSVAGGGTLLTFPALTWILGSSAAAAVTANATSTVALFPGSIAATWGFRRELVGQKAWIIPLLIPSLIGSIVGTWLVVTQPEKIFQAMVPWLILSASALFLLQPAITKWTGIGKPHAQPTSSTMAGIIGFQFFIAVYGGYFGAGIGILMLTSLALMGLSDIHRMNALKGLLASAINGMSVLMFIFNARVDWHYGIPMLVAGIAGGFVGATVSRQLNKNLVRGIVIAIGFGLSTFYFTQVYLPGLSHKSESKISGAPHEPKIIV